MNGQTEELSKSRWHAPTIYFRLPRIMGWV